MMVTAIRYFKSSGEYIVTERNTITGKTSKTYSNTLTKNERIFVENSRFFFEDESCACWMN